MSTEKANLTDDDTLQDGVIDFIAGSLGGAAQVYVSQPLDTVKVKQQVFPHLYSSMIDCILRTYRNDGVLRGLYAGTTPALIANVAENSVLFAAYGSCQRFVAYLTGTQHIEDLTTLDNAFAGFFAAFFSTFTLCPTELVKCKLQAVRELRENSRGIAGGLHVTPWMLTRQIYRQEGVRGFYHGIGSTFIREMPGYFFFFGGYEGAREYFTEPGGNKDDIGALKTMVAGAIGGVLLWTAIIPADVIKSRIQIGDMKRGMISVGAEIMRKEGVKALYSGLLPSLIRTVPATATLFLVYEYIKKLLSGRS